MTEYTIRRTGITEAMILRVYDKVLELGAPTNVTLRRAMPETCATSITKALGELKDRGWVVKDNDWPPRYRTTGRMKE